MCFSIIVVFIWRFFSFSLFKNEKKEAVIPLSKGSIRRIRNTIQSVSVSIIVHVYTDDSDESNKIQNIICLTCVLPVLSFFLSFAYATSIVFEITRAFVFLF